MKLAILTLCLALPIATAQSAHADATCTESRQGKLNGDSLYTVINKDAGKQLSPEYVPPSLAKIPTEFLSPLAPQNQQLRASAIAAFAKMHQAAADQGIKLFIRSAYRSFDDQCRTFASKVGKFSAQFSSKERGLSYARKISAEPGRSQHQLGTTMDIVFPELSYDFSITKADKTTSFRWLDERAQDFGFIMSFPFADDDAEDFGYNAATGYFFEPWHWRYVGVKQAKAFRASHLLPDAFLQTLN